MFFGNHDEKSVSALLTIMSLQWDNLCLNKQKERNREERSIEWLVSFLIVIVY